jgi:hypothetical protein
MERRYVLKALLWADQSVHQVGGSFCSPEASSFLTDDFVIISRNHANNPSCVQYYYMSLQYL